MTKTEDLQTLITEHAKMLATLQALMRPAVFGGYGTDCNRFFAVYEQDVWEQARKTYTQIAGETPERGLP